MSISNDRLDSLAVAKPRTASAPRRRIRRAERIWTFRVLAFLMIVVLWELASRTVIEPFWISRPSAIAAKLWYWASSGVLFRNLFFTLEETAVGFLVGGALGIALGGLVAQNRTLQQTMDPFVTAIYGIPKIALAPLFIMWFGIGLMPKFVLAGVSVFFQVFFNTLAGARQVDTGMVEALQLMGARPAQIHRILVIPASFPFIFLGLKLGLPLGFVGAVAGEMLASNEGIGYLTQSSAGQFDTSGVFAALVALMAVMLILHGALGWIERWVFRWK